MSNSLSSSRQLQEWLDRIQIGDLSARDELVRAYAARLEQLARRMLRSFPGVRRWEDTSDVLQGALVRLVRALDTVRPSSTKELLGLAATQVRRELLDLVRHHFGPLGAGTHHDSTVEDDGSLRPLEPSAISDEPSDLEKWAAFHEAVEELPVEEREVVGLVFYHGWSQADVAELFQVSIRTVQRRWDSALAKLHRVLHGL